MYIIFGGKIGIPMVPKNYNDDGHRFYNRLILK